MARNQKLTPSLVIPLLRNPQLASIKDPGLSGFANINGLESRNRDGLFELCIADARSFRYFSF
jgi:hypothetical protein